MRSTGLVVLDSNLKVLRHGLIRTETIPKQVKDRTSGLRPSGVYRGSQEERIEYQARLIIGCVQQFEPTKVMIEGHAFNTRGVGNATITHELHGVIKNRLLRNGYRIGESVEIIAPRSLKKHITGTGTAEKDEMVAAVSEIWRECPNDDEADAWGLALLGLGLELQDL